MSSPLLRPGLLFGLLLAVALPAQAVVEVHPSIELALERLYNFDFDGAHATLDAYEALEPGDPIGFTIRGAVYLFYELDRLRILQTEFFEDDEKIVEKKKLRPDPAVQERFLTALATAESLANARLARRPGDLNAHFALCLRAGLVTDYVALVQRRGLRSMRHARIANEWALKLLDLEPQFHDAHLGTGINEYLIGSLPFFVRWFVRIEGVEGSKERAFQNLELVAREGRYLGPFAKVLLSIMALREDQPERARTLLAELTREFPENPLLRKEFHKVNRDLVSAER